MDHETFFSLLKDPAHWEFEIFLMVLIDGIALGLLWPRIKGWLTHHQGDDDQLADLQKKVKAIQDKLGMKEDGQ